MINNSMSAGDPMMMPTQNYSYLSTASSNRASIDERDWKHQYDVLHRELERKDHRNDILVKELQQLRKVCADQQRELRLTGNLAERVKEENQQLNKELLLVKDKNYTLLGKLKVLSNSQALLNKVHALEADKEALQEKITSLNGELSLKEGRHKALQEELVIAHRSIQVQSKYEKLLTFHPNAINNRDAMRALYYDMGKQQSNLHSITLSLTETTKELQASKQEAQRLGMSKEELEKECAKLRSNCDRLIMRSVEHADLISHLKEDIRRLGDIKEELLQENQSLRDQIRRDAAMSAEELHRREETMDALSDQLSQRERDCEQLRQRVENFQQALSVVETMQMSSEQKSADEVNQLRAEIKVLLEKNLQHSVVASQLEMTRKALLEMEHAKQSLDSEVVSLRNQLVAAEKQAMVSEKNVDVLDDKCRSLSAELMRSREQWQVAALERSEAADALRQTMRAAKDLSQRYAQEKDLRLAADQRIEQLQRTRASMADATLEALHQEKRKSAALQQSLSLVPLVLKWRLAAHPDRGNILSSLRDLQKATDSASPSDSSSSGSHNNSSSTNSDLSRHPLDATDHMLHVAGEDATYIEQSLATIARLLEAPLLDHSNEGGVVEGISQWLGRLHPSDARIDSLPIQTINDPHLSPSSPSSSSPLLPINSVSLLDIASNALESDAKAAIVVDSPGTVRIISALRGSSNGGRKDGLSTDSQVEADGSMVIHGGGAGDDDRSMVSRRKSVIFRSEETMMDELQRLRNEFSTIDIAHTLSTSEDPPHDTDSSSHHRIPSP